MPEKCKNCPALPFCQAFGPELGALLALLVLDEEARREELARQAGRN